MQNLSKFEDEIDLRELFLTLWAYKFLIAFICALSIVYSGYIVLNTDKKYTSTAIFRLDKGVDNNVAFNSQFGTIAKITGLSSNIDNENLSKDLLNGRIFIEKLDSKLNFQSDTYYNTFDPNSVDPTWKSIIKRAIGWQKPLTDPQEAIWQGIVNTYNNSIVIEETKSGSTKIMVTHMNPQRASEIANVIMTEIISSTRNKRNTEQDQRLSYLSNTLAEALSDLEISQSNLKEFALKNSALPLESFAAGSLQLEALREQLSRTSELHEAVAALAIMLKNKTTSHSNYLALRKSFPIIDQVEFRRVLGQNEIISSWSWPEANSVGGVFNTLSDRKIRLEAQINALQIDAKRLGLEVEAYAKLERDAKIAEATYTVLIEQVKAQSMAVGYRPDKTEIYEYAAASMRPTSPKRNMILALGATLGLFLGAALSLVLARQRGVYFSKNSLKTGAQARFTGGIRALLPLRNKTLNELNLILLKNPRIILRELAVEINKNAAAQVVITSSRAKMTANDVARALSSYMQSDTMKIALIDFSSKVKKSDNNSKKPSIGSFIVEERMKHLSVLKPAGDFEVTEMITQRDFWQNIQSLNSSFELIFLCADNSNAISLLSALEGKKTLHITLARTKKTKSAILTQMRSLLPVQGLLYD